MSLSINEQATVWKISGARLWHAWSMLERSFVALENSETTTVGFDIEYAWENLILRLWIFRTAAKTMELLTEFREVSQKSIKIFDATFEVDGSNSLKVFRDYIEHFNDYAIGKGHGPARHEYEADPWRNVTIQRFEFGPYYLELAACKSAASQLRKSAFAITGDFRAWYHSEHS